LLLFGQLVEMDAAAAAGPVLGVADAADRFETRHARQRDAQPNRISRDLTEQLFCKHNGDTADRCVHDREPHLHDASPEIDADVVVTDRADADVLTALLHEHQFSSCPRRGPFFFRAHRCERSKPPAGAAKLAERAGERGLLGSSGGQVKHKGLDLTIACAHG
jgi:hypothetical protein